MSGVVVHNLRKSFGVTTVLDGVSLDIAHGEFLTLVGPSGCGKSTLLRIIAGLDHADSGSVEIDGRPVDDLPPKARDVAMVFQSYALYPYMTVAENISLPLAMRRMTGCQRLPLLGRFLPGAGAAQKALASEVRAVAGSLDLGHLMGRQPGQLSGGQRQRVALARAMVREPAAFLMDEPLSNLDAKLRVQARAEIAELHRRLGATFIYVTHDQVEAMTMSDRVAVMLGGQLLQVDAPQAVYDAPASLAVARFIGTPEINVLPARALASGVEVLGRPWPLRVALPAGAPLALGVRPEVFRIDDLDGGGYSPALSGAIRYVERLGSETLVHVGVEGLDAPLVARLEPHARAHLALGARITLSARVERVLAFAGETGARLAAEPLLSTPIEPAWPRLSEAARG